MLAEEQFITYRCKITMHRGALISCSVHASVKADQLPSLSDNTMICRLRLKKADYEI